MKKSRRPTQATADLRKQAEKRLRERRAQDQPKPSADPQRLLHELSVHQLELEIQNEELRAARREVEMGLERYTELFDFAPIGYFVIADNSTIREANLAGARLLGIERQQLVNQHFSHFVSNDDADTWNRFLRRVLTGDTEEQRSETCDLRLLWANHEPVEAHITATSLASMTALVAVEDVTGRKHAEAAIREKGRQKDEFLAILSHELRNPLAPISNSLFVLERAAPGGERARKAEAVIGRQVTHLTRIIDDLLDVTRVARGKIRLQIQRFELGDLVRRTLDDHREMFEKNGIQFEGQLGFELLWIDADATRIIQVLGNLLANAGKFTPRGGKVKVSLHRKERTAVLVVRDTGVGIAPEVRSGLFEPFRQAPQNLDRSRGGLGLGLAMVKGLVDLHGGAVDVASEGIGRGSVFTVRLPLQPSPLAPVRLTEPQEIARRHILIIEDNVDAVDSLREALELGGHETIAAYDGTSGLALARDFGPNVIICDIGLPGIDGYEVARTIRAEESLKGSFLIALTGYALPEDVQRAIDAGFDRHIAKPPDLQKLQQVISDAPKT